MMLKIIRNGNKNFSELYYGSIRLYSSTDEKKESTRLKEFRKKLNEEIPINEIKKETKPGVTDNGKLKVQVSTENLNKIHGGQHPDQEKEPLKAFPNNINPVTGEHDGPKGPEPTRYGDWERKGRVTDF